MVVKSLDFVPFNETLHLPLKVWGSHALHKESLGSARSPEVQGRHSEALWHLSVSHSETVCCWLREGPGDITFM